MEAAAGLKTWNQAFEEYPIVTTRNIEKQLRANVAQSKDRLRTLVGGSYRNLLATAEEIVQLEGQTHAIETKISELSRSCKPPPPHPQDVSSSLATSKILLAHLELIRRCVSVIPLALRQGRLLLGAKLLVLSRLLHRSLANANDTLKSLDSLQERIASLRRRVLALVDKRLSKSNVIQQVLIEASCAFCLITNSSSTDALQHFHQLRLEVIHSKMNRSGSEISNISKHLTYYVRSLGNSHILLGHRMSDSMRSLQSQPILHDPALKGLIGLELDDLAKLIAPEISNFVPYLRKPDLTTSQSDEMLQSWSVDAFKAFTKNLTQISYEVHDVSTMLKLRETLFSTWLPVCFSTKAHCDVFEGLRNVINDRISFLLKDQATELIKIGKALVDSVTSTAVRKDLWAPQFVSSQLRKGATYFLQQLRSRHSGLSEGQRACLFDLHKWTTRIEACYSQIQDARKVRWQDRIEEAEEDHEEAAAFTLHTLDKTDLQIYEDSLEIQLKDSKRDFEQKFAETSQQVETSSDINQITSLLRLLRESKSRLTHAFADQSFTQMQSAIHGLHGALAAEVAKRLSDAVRQGTSLPDVKIEADALPSNLPSPRAFDTLKRLCMVMLDVGGTDLWSQAAVISVKTRIWELILKDEHKLNYMQSSFDEAYLQAALQPEKTADRKLLVNGESDTTRRALDYWKRTQILFGLLA